MTDAERQAIRMHGFHAEQKAVEAQLIMSLAKAKRYEIPLLRILELVNGA